MLMEQATVNNLAKSIEDRIEDDETEINPEEVKKDKSKTYRISGGLLTLHGKDKKDLQIKGTWLFK
jgi:hypothetical protein